MKPKPNPTIQPDSQHPTELERGNPWAKWACLLSLVWKNIFSFRLQNVLTLMTMAIGALALAATLFAGDGALVGLWTDLDRLMGNRVIVYADAGPGQLLLKRRPSEDFTPEDLTFLKAEVPQARYIVSRFFGQSHVAFRRKELVMPVDGIEGNLESEAAFVPVMGQGFSPKASRGFTMECLLTRSAVKSLGLPELEKSTIRLDNHRFRVVGVVEDPPEADERFSARVVVPFFWARLIWGRPGAITSLVVAWPGPQEMESTIARLRQALDACRAPGAYYISSSQFKIKKRKQIVSNFMALGTAQSFFCIVVAAMGIVNVMLVSVVRRRREYAIRVAMGARQQDIVIMVLLESFFLGIMGAAIGITLAALVSPPLCQLISSKIREAAELQPLISARSITIPLVVCGLSGLVAGVIPALRTRRMDILFVLRSE